MTHPRVGKKTVAAGVAIGLLAAVCSSAGGSNTPASATTVPVVQLPRVHLGPLVRLAGVGAPMPTGSVETAAISGSKMLSVEIALRPSDPAALASFVAAVSDPSSPDYQHYLARGEFAQRFGASSESIAETSQWLSDRGLDQVTTDPDHLGVTVNASASRIDAAFGVALREFRLTDGATRFAPSSQPLVPSALATQVQAVLGLTDLGVPQPLIEKVRVTHLKKPVTERRTTALSPEFSGPTACTAAQDAAQGGAYTSSELADAYSIPAAYAQGRLGAGVSVAVYELEPFSPSDIAGFQSCYGTDAAVSVTNVDGGPGSGSGSGEAALDIEQIIGIAPESSIHVYAGPTFNHATAAEALGVYQRIADDDTSTVVSTSWGICEAGLVSGFASAESSVFEQMASQGQSMFAAAGDSGSEDCFEPGASTDSALAVDDPGSQPYVTSVGGTSLASAGPPPSETVWNSCQGQSESSCAIFGSPNGAGGGGISALWSMPSWQTGPGVINSNSSSAPCASVSGDCREVPDVSASADPAHGVVILFQGAWQVVGGTSAAAPLWAAVTALVDQGCTTPGESFANSHVVGFANPKIYALGSASTPPFDDITSGNNDFTDSHAGHYPATTHYDMASGWGSPIVSSLLADLQPAGGCPVVSGITPQSGITSGQTAVTISGTDLAGATAVYFAGSPATDVVYNSSTDQVTANSPASAARGALNVTVTTPNGTSAPTAQDVFDYIGPSVDSVVPPAGDPGGGTTVQLNGGGFTGATAVQFGSVAAESFAVETDGTIIAVSPPAPNGSVVDVTVTTPIGTSPTFDDDHFTYTLDPVVSGIAPSAGTVRGGTPVTISGANFEGATGVYFGGMPATFAVSSAESVTATSPASVSGAQVVPVTVVSAIGSSAQWSSATYTYTLPESGYWLAASDGGIFSYGGAGYFGSMGGKRLNAPIVAIASTNDDNGYWLAATDGGIFSFGDAGFHGSMGGRHLNAPIVGIATTLDGRGYWLVASDGGVFSFGDAGYFGSMGAKPLNAPIVGIDSTPDGKGYWLVASDGGVFSFGDAGFHGSMGGRSLNAPIVGIARSSDGSGYWMVASDGGIFSFGDAGFHGSMGGKSLNAPIVGMASSVAAGGYWLTASDGGIFAFGAPFSGSAGDLPLVAPVVGMAAT